MNVPSRQLIRIFKTDIIYQNNFCILGKAFAYKSAQSLDKLYPKSNLKLFTPAFVPEDPNAKFNGYLPLKELEITYSRSSGSGGQHVNRTNSKVDVRFHVKSATWLSEEIKDKLLEQVCELCKSLFNKKKLFLLIYSLQNESKITKGGYLTIKSELTRSQQLNLADALEKLRTIIREAAEPPAEIPPESEEYKRKLLLKAARKRLFEKRKRSEIKQIRTETYHDF
ncbi:Peptidyl-tRNA hydrolase ICT1, mitochondrial [Anthophora retusa]